jgi:hypothetical protein
MKWADPEREAMESEGSGELLARMRLIRRHIAIRAYRESPVEQQRVKPLWLT